MKKISIYLASVAAMFAIENGVILGLGIGSTSTEAELELTGTYYSGATPVGTYSASGTSDETGSTAEIYLGYRYNNYQFGLISGSIATEESEESTSTVSYSILACDYLFSKTSFKPFAGLAVGQSNYDGSFTLDSSKYSFEATSPAYGVRVGFLYDMESWSLGLRYQYLLTNPKIDDSFIMNNISGSGIDFNGNLAAGYKNFSSTMFTANYHF